MVSSDAPLEGAIDYNLEGEVSGTEDGIIQENDDELMDITHG